MNQSTASDEVRRLINAMRENFDAQISVFIVSPETLDRIQEQSLATKTQSIDRIYGVRIEVVYDPKDRLSTAFGYAALYGSKVVYENEDGDMLVIQMKQPESDIWP